MGIYASSEGEQSKRWLHPAGAFPSVLVDVVDLGLRESTFEGVKSMKHKIRLNFWCGEYNEENEPLFASQMFTCTLHENGALRPFLEAWRGREFSDVELKKFDLESLLNVPAYITIVHKKVGERTYANVAAAAKLPKGAESIQPLADYVRAHLRVKEEAKQPVAAPSGPVNAWEDPDDDLPF